MTDHQDDWHGNYFNYFTEVEEHFQKARGTAMFRISTLDWALLESWKNSGVPLAAVLRGIDAAFEKWRSKKTKTQAVNSLAYCAQAIAQAAQDIAKGGPSVNAAASKESSAPFPLEDLQSYFAKNIADLEKQNYPRHHRRTPENRRRVRILVHEPRRTRNAPQRPRGIRCWPRPRARQDDESLFNARRELDLQLRPYRGKMTTEQLSMLERQFLERKLLDSSNLPRLSLFYLR